MFALFAHYSRAVWPPRIVLGVAVMGALGLLCGPPPVAAQRQEGVSEPMSGTLNAWLDDFGGDGEQAAAIRARLASLPQAGGFDLADVDRLVRALAPADTRIEELVRQVDTQSVPGAPPEWLSAEELPPSVRPNIAVRAAAEHFVRRRYAECLAWLAAGGDPSSAARELAFYYRAVANHQLVRMAPAAAAADELLAIDSPRSRRSHEMAQLVKRDAEAHEAGSLTHVAQQMNDVERRLQLGRTGEEEQALQQDVIDAIDKLIDDAEEARRRQQQQQQQQQQIAQGGRSMAPKPLEESRATEMKAPGEVDDRDITPGGDWGSLPPAQRERVTQGIIRDFPAHYREVIEDYFRSLAQPQRRDQETP